MQWPGYKSPGIAQIPTKCPRPRGAVAATSDDAPVTAQQHLVARPCTSMQTYIETSACSFRSKQFSQLDLALAFFSTGGLGSVLPVRPSHGTVDGHPTGAGISCVWSRQAQKCTKKRLLRLDSHHFDCAGRQQCEERLPPQPSTWHSVSAAAQHSTLRQVV